MPSSSHSFQPSRRAFLRSIAAAGALALTPLAAGPAMAAPGTTIRPTLRLGLLQPQMLGIWAPDSLSAGIAAVAQRAGWIQTTAYMYARSQSAALALAQQLIYDDQVDLLVGMLSRNHIATLEPLLQEHGIPLIVSDVGANVVSRPGPLVARSSLNHWQSAWALGRWSARNLGRTALIATAFYESGYDHIYAFQHGFEQAGGRILATSVTHTPTAPATPADVVARARELRPDLVFAAYNGDSAGEFLRAYATLGRQIPLVGPGFLADSAAIADLGGAAIGIRTAATWGTEPVSPGLGAQQLADPFAALGYDTALLIEAAAGEARGADLVERLGSVAVVGARGPIRVDPSTNEAGAPIMLSEIRRIGGTIGATPIAEIGHAAEIAARTHEVRPEIRTGWTHAYLARY